MRFLGLSMRDGFYSGKYDFQNVNVVYSKANKKGKIQDKKLNLLFL